MLPPPRTPIVLGQVVGELAGLRRQPAKGHLVRQRQGQVRHRGAGPRTGPGQWHVPNDDQLRVGARCQNRAHLGDQLGHFGLVIVAAVGAGGRQTVNGQRRRTRAFKLRFEGLSESWVGFAEQPERVRDERVFVAAPTVTDDDLGGKREAVTSNITSPVLSLKLNFPGVLPSLGASLQFRNSRTTAKFCSAAWLMSGRLITTRPLLGFFTTRFKWTSADAGGGSLDFSPTSAASEAAPASDSSGQTSHQREPPLSFRSPGGRGHRHHPSPLTNSAAGPSGTQPEGAAAERPRCFPSLPL